MNSPWFSRVLSLFLAVFCWYLVTGRERVDSWVPVKLEMAGLSENLVLRGAPRGQLDVLVRGPKGLIRKIDPQSLVYTLNAHALGPGLNTVVIDPESIPLAKLFEVVEIRPSTLELDVEKRLVKSVPVRLVYKNGASRDYKIEGVVEPANVSISGPESLVREVSDIPTQPLTLPDDPMRRVDSLVNLVLPEQVEAIPRMVKAQVTFQAQEREAAVEVRVAIVYKGKALVRLARNTITVRVKAPAAVMREPSWKDAITATVDVDAKISPGRYDLAYRVTLPQGYSLVEAKPATVPVLVK